MSKIFQGLNVAQKAAVTSSSPVLQVLAPPGSGKTKTLTSRVAYLLSHEKYAPWNVIYCTFTIKASREMRERLRGMIGEELESKLILGTFHSVCRRYLVAYGHLIGIDKNFGVADSDDSLSIIKRAVKRLKLSIDPKVARSRISHRKARGKRLEDLPQATAHKNVEAQEFVTVLREYEDALALSNLLDYDDLLMKCVDLLRQHPQCVSNIEALLIDEFQDTNVVQFELMKLLASAKRRITIVGDPDQSIYGFRSAEIENLKRMKAFYPNTVVINLEENYRSASAVLKLAQQVIEQDTNRPQKKLKSTHRYGTPPVLRKLPNPHEEAQWIVSEIRRVTLMTGNLINYNDIAILLRSAFLSLLIEKALANMGIPYRMVGGRRFFDRVEVRLLLDYLRAISHPDNTSALLAIINTPARKIGDTTVKELTRIAEVKKESLWSICTKIAEGRLSLDKKLTKPAEQGLNELLVLIRRARQKMETMKAEEAPGKLIEHVIHSLDYQNYLKKQYTEDHEERWENVKELVTQASDTSLHFHAPDEELPVIDGVTQAKENGAQEVLSRFLANVVLSTEVESKDAEEQKPRITISTIHSAKGLEWPVVFIPAVYNGSIPHSRAEDTDEERRLLYVAMTRAQALLYMTFPIAQSRDESESVLSPFLSRDIKSLVRETGPLFHDNTIEDIASILRRPVPSQENITKSHASIKAHESRNDDVWPSDGSRRQRVVSSDSDPVSFVLQKGQSLSDALRANGSNEPYTGYSMSTYQGQSPAQSFPTMNNTIAFSTSSMSMDFTTANQHLKTMPQPKAHESRSSSIVDEGEHVSKKPRLTKSKSAPSRGNISSFFSTGSMRSQTTTAMPGSALAKGQLKGSNQPAKPEPYIPQNLVGHRLSIGSTFRKGNPRMALAAVTAGAHNTNGNREYGSPAVTSIHEHQEPTSHVIKEKSGHAENRICGVSGPYEHSPNIKPTTNLTTRTRHNSTIIAAGGVGGGGALNRSFPRSNSFQSSQLNRLGTLNPLNNMNGMMGMDQSRKTLGVRRSMNGWENRKNK